MPGPPASGRHMGFQHMCRRRPHPLPAVPSESPWTAWEGGRSDPNEGGGPSVVGVGLPSMFGGFPASFVVGRFEVGLVRWFVVPCAPSGHWFGEAASPSGAPDRPAS